MSKTLLTVLQKGAAADRQAAPSESKDPRGAHAAGPRVPQEAGSSSVAKAYPQVHVTELASVGYQTLQTWLKASGADVESVMRTDRSRAGTGEGKAGRLGRLWADVDAFDKGPSQYSLQE